MAEKDCKRIFAPVLPVALEQPVDDAARQTSYEGNARQLLHLASARGILASLRLIAYTALLVETLRTRCPFHKFAASYAAARL